MLSAENVWQYRRYSRMPRAQFNAKAATRFYANQPVENANYRLALDIRESLSDYYHHRCLSEKSKLSDTHNTYFYIIKK